MSGRWHIPLAMLAFAVLILALRSYLRSGEDLPPIPKRGGVETDAAFESLSSGDQTPFAIGTRRRPAAGGSTFDRRGTHSNRRGRSYRSWPQRLDAVALRLDDAAVRLRSNLGGSLFVQSLRGYVDARSGRHIAALEHFDQVLAKHPGLLSILSAKAEVLIALQRFDEAISVYEQAIGVAPSNARLRYNYGTLLYRRARFIEAADQFRETVRIDPHHALAQYNLATLAQREGRISEARQAWLAFTDLQPDVSEAWFNLGVVWMDFEEPLLAAHCFSQFTAMSPGDPDGWLNLALAYRVADHLPLALDALSIADDLAPCNPIIMRHLAGLHAFMEEQADPRGIERDPIPEMTAEQIESSHAAAVEHGPLDAP